MNIGILTYHSCLNYGADLQLFANVKMLERMGHEVFVFDNLDPVEGPFRDFVVQHTTLTNPCRTDEEFRAETLRLGLDVLLVGSDAVLWFLPGKRAGRGAYPNPFWLRWARDLPVRKALISASCMGVMFFKIRGALKRELKADLDAFDFIAVRDRWTRMLSRWIGVRGAELVFDPTSCLPDLFQPRPGELPEPLSPGKYILLSFSNAGSASGWIAELTRQANSAGLKTCFIPHPDRPVAPTGANIQFDDPLDPLEWLNILCCSAAYVGERFHPVVLSAFFGVPFLACDYYSKSGAGAIFSGRSKTKDFCVRVGLLKRLMPSDRFFRKTDPKSVIALARNEEERISIARAGEYAEMLKRAVEGA